MLTIADAKNNWKIFIFWNQISSVRKKKNKLYIIDITEMQVLVL